MRRRDLRQHLAAPTARAREATRAERAVAHHGDAARNAPRDHRVLDRALIEVVEYLVARDALGPGERGRALQLLDAEVADAPGADLPLAPEPREGRDGFRQRVATRPVEEVAVEAIGAEAAEARLARARHPRTRGVLGQHLGDEEDLVAPPGDRLADQLLDAARAVHLRRVDVRHAGVEPGAERGQRRRAPVALQVPRPLADDGHADARRPERLASHRIRSRTAGSTCSTGAPMRTSAAAS